MASIPHISPAPAVTYKIPHFKLHPFNAPLPYPRMTGPHFEPTISQKIDEC